MRNLLRDLRSTWQAFVHPEPWPEPERDETTPEVIAAWIASHKHPAECNGGCRCEQGGEVG